MFGDVEITVESAKALIKKCPDHDVIVTAEAKGIPLGYEMARQENKDYVVARKGLKVYMPEYVNVEVRSITTLSLQKLYIGTDDINKIKGKRVLIVDDVISTGESLLALEKLVEKAGGTTVGKVAVLAEGDAADRDDIIFLEKLPVFPK
jgi:adenine phosphoribosyltransferase